MKEITLANVVLVLLRGVKATVEITIDPVIEGLERGLGYYKPKPNKRSRR